MEIKFDYDFKNNTIKKNDLENNHNDCEYEILNFFIDKLNEYNLNDFDILNNTDKYLTLKYKELDIARIKYTNNTQWISVIVLDKKENLDNPLFELETNKNKLQWKSKFDYENIDKYIPFLAKACQNFDDMQG